jgi:hypothetical protein
LKDLVLGVAVLVAMVGFWFSNVQKRKAQKQMKSLMKDVECLQDAEKNLTSLQDRYVRYKDVDYYLIAFKHFSWDLEIPRLKIIMICVLR